MGLTTLLILAQLTAGGLPSGPCTGDCDGNGQIAISELVRGVNISLGRVSIGTCPSFDSDRSGSVSITELVRAVSDARFGCGVRPPTPSPTVRRQVPTPTPTGTPLALGTATPSGLLFGGTVEELVPHGLGDNLIYRVTWSGQNGMTTETRAVVDQLGAVFVVATREGSKREEEELVDRGDELVLRATDDLDDNVETRCSPSLVQLETPLFAGDEFSTASQCTLRTIPGGVFLGSVPQSNTVVAEDLVASLSVPAGTYENVVRLTSTFKFQGGVEVNETWLAPGIGIVRQLQVTDIVTITRELTDGAVGGESVKR